MASPTAMTLAYVQNATGVRTAAQLATRLATALTIALSASWLKMLASSVTSITGSVNGSGQAQVVLVLNTNNATFRMRYPSVQVGGSAFGPFAEVFTGVLRQATNQPVLALNPIPS